MSAARTRTVQAITPLGPSASSVRTRVYEWLRRSNARYHTSSYAGLRTAHPKELVRRPLAVLKAEANLRRMAGRSHDVLLMLREASPLSQGDLEVRLLHSAELSVYDFDDALQLDWGNGVPYRSLIPKAPKAEAAVKSSDRVIAGNAILADWASTLNDDVTVIPTCIEPDDYDLKLDYELSDPPRLGWIGAEKNEWYLRTIGEALVELNRRTGARLTVISGPGRRLGDLESLIDRVRWTESVQRWMLRSFDLGIMPLLDGPFERGKCGYKLLQYAAAGVPAVGSPVGVNEDILGAADLPAPRTNADWVDAVTELLSMSAGSRQELAERGRKVAETQYSYSVWLERWCAAVLGA